MLKEIRELGFEYAELSHGIRISLVPGILEAVQAGEIKISTLHNFCPLPMGINYAAPNIFKFTSAERRERENAWTYSLKTIEFAERVGARLIVLHSGAVDLKDYNEKLEEYVEKGLKDSPKYQRLVQEVEEKRLKRIDEPRRLAIEMIQALAGVAGPKGIMLGIENREAVEEIPFDDDISFFLGELPENVRYWHDCGHAQIKENLGFIAQHRMHFESLAPRLGGCHIHDVIPPGIDHCPPGSGMIDFAALAPWVKPEHLKVLEMNPNVPVDDVKKGFDHIRSLWGAE